MAKAKTQTENAETATENGTAPEKTETLSARMKRLIMSVASEIKEYGELEDDTVTFLEEVSTELIEAGARGIPYAIRLENAQNQRNEIYKRAGVVDDVFSFATPEDEALNEALTVKIRNLKNSIAKEKAETKGTSETES